MAFLVILAVLVFIVLVLVSRIRIVPQANVYVVERLVHSIKRGAPASTSWYRLSTVWQNGSPLRNR